MPGRIKHPGPVSAERIISREGELIITEIHLKKGKTLMEAVSLTLEPMGIRGAGIHFENLKLQTANYVMPTYSSDDRHVAFYSETHEEPEGITVDTGRATYGYRGGVPFMHFHGLWKKGGKQQGGHLLPSDCVVAEDCKAIAYSAGGIGIASVDDKETNFTIFTPETVGEAQISHLSRKCVVATVKANEDLQEALVEIGKKHGLKRTRVWTGIGSTVGGVFENGEIVHEIPTELMIFEGTVDDEQAYVDTVLIDAAGSYHFGTLKQGKNPVLILFELVLTEGESVDDELCD